MEALADAVLLLLFSKLNYLTKSILGSWSWILTASSSIWNSMILFEVKGCSSFWLSFELISKLRSDICDYYELSFEFWWTVVLYFFIINRWAIWASKVSLFLSVTLFLAALLAALSVRWLSVCVYCVHWDFVSILKLSSAWFISGFPFSAILRLIIGFSVDCFIIWGADGSICAFGFWFKRVRLPILVLVGVLFLAFAIYELEKSATFNSIFCAFCGVI